MILLYAFEHFLIPGSFRFLEFSALIRTILSNFVNHKKIIPRYFLMRLPSHPSKYRIFFIPLSLFIHFSGLIDSSHNQFWGKTCKNVIDANFIFCVLLQSRIHIEAFFLPVKWHKFPGCCQSIKCTILRVIFPIEHLYKSTKFWVNFGCILTAFWLHFDCILAAFWLHFDCILTDI